MSKSTKARTGSRRDELRRNLPKPTLGLRSLVQRPDLVKASALLFGFIVLASVLVMWSRDQLTVAAGQVMTNTRLHRMDIDLVDEARTAAARAEAREKAPFVYSLNDEFLSTLRRPLATLPVVVAQQSDLANISDDIRIAYALDQPSVAALARYASGEDGPTEPWSEWVRTLLEKTLPRARIVHNDDWQLGQQQWRRHILRMPDGRTSDWGGTISVGAEGEAPSAELLGALTKAARDAGFPEEVVPHLAAGLAYRMRPTYVFDPDATRELADIYAARVTNVPLQHRRGDVIYQRGDELDNAQLAELKRESDFFASEATLSETWLPRLGVFGLVGILCGVTGGFVAMSYPRIRRNALRIAAIGLLMCGMLAVCVVLSGRVPQLVYPSAVATSLFVATILLLAYDRRLALFLSTVQCALVTLALSQGIGWFVLLIAGCGTMIAQLRELRHRHRLIRAAIVTAAVLGAGTLLLGLIVYPPVTTSAGTRAMPWFQILGNAAWSVTASVGIGFFVLGILPSIERVFDITTGMTLAELRDPSQPLLRQLQQRAPGTYNHSLQVANIAEAAADAIGADGLLVYVGALYHDIGKMNKPEYFIENQTSGVNKHSKLRPAMSLLVIIGHVKDGIELAREYGLPRTLQHFIESHHGTTLVEYFYHAAKSTANVEKGSVDEVEFRYPGPRPRTKEAALLMLADAVESATRAMTEPNPSRIENLVRELSRKRLLDGQFDESSLTFRELGLIEDAVIARVCAIHHGRISYPSTARAEEPAESASGAFAGR